MPNQNKTRLAREGVINLIKFSILISRIPSPQYKEVRSVLVRRPSQFIVQLMTIPNISHMIYIVAEFYSPPWYLQYLMGRNLSICTDLRMYLRCPCMTPLITKLIRTLTTQHTELHCTMAPSAPGENNRFLTNICVSRSVLANKNELPVTKQ